MRQLTATRRLVYGRQVLESGDRFEAPEQHAKVLVAIGKAEAAPELDTEPAAAPADADEAAPKGKAKGTYSRRDLRAK